MPNADNYGRDIINKIKNLNLIREVYLVLFPWSGKVLISCKIPLAV